MFLFGGGSSKSKKEDSKKARESQEIKDLQKRAKEAKKKRESFQNTEIRSSTEQSFPISSPLLSVDDAKLYQVYDVYKFSLSNNPKHQIEGDVLLERKAKPQWGIDPMLIDEELLYLEDAEADRVYLELKIKSERRREMEIRQNRLSSQMSLDEDAMKRLGSLDSRTESMLSAGSNYEAKLSLTSQNSLVNPRQSKYKQKDEDQQQKQKSQAYEKIRSFIQKSSMQEKLEFTQGIINFAHKIDKKFLIDGLLPNLERLTKEKEADIKIALIDQFIPIINYLSEACGQRGYEESCKTIFQHLDFLLYDPNEQIRDKAIQILTELRNVVQDKENDLIMKLTLRLAHDDLEMNRISSLKIMNELAPYMGELLCESFICPEMRSLSIDELPTVRQAVTKNMINATKQVSMKYFNQHQFPMYDRLSKEGDEKIRKGCAEIISDIAKCSDIEAKGALLQEMYFKFLKDPTSKIVRGTAYQNIGAFIANFKDKMPIEPKIIDFFISTTESSSNKDVCYYSSYNLPAFIFVLGPDFWERIKPLYLKCFKFNEAKIQKTLGHSIHEFARILGPKITQEDLVPIIRKFLSESNQFKEARTGALKSLHIFLEQVEKEERKNYLNCILPPKENKELDWRGKHILAQNFGAYCLLFDEDVVFESFLPVFFRFSFDPVAKVAETISLGLAKLLKSLSSNMGRIEQIVKLIRKFFFQSKTYKRRQLFVMMCSSLIQEDYATLDVYFKRDLLTLVDDKVITVRMTLVRILTTHPIEDKDISRALSKLAKDKCGDIRELVAQHAKIRIETIEMQKVPHSLEIDDMRVDNSLDHIELDMHMEIMVEEEMYAAMQQFQETQSKLRSSIYGEELYK